MKLVQKALNHSNIATTARYAGVMDDDVAAAWERVDEIEKKAPEYPQTGKENAAGPIELTWKK